MKRGKWPLDFSAQRESLAVKMLLTSRHCGLRIDELLAHIDHVFCQDFIAASFFVFHGLLGK